MADPLFNKYNAYSDDGRCISEAFDLIFKPWVEVLCERYNPRELELLCIDNITSIMAEIRLLKGLELKKKEKETGI